MLDRTDDIGIAADSIWGFGDGLAQCRIGSKHRALQIKAIEEGLLPRGAR